MVLVDFVKKHLHPAKSPALLNYFKASPSRLVSKQKMRGTITAATHFLFFDQNLTSRQSV